MKMYLLGLLVVCVVAGVGCKDSTAPLTEGAPDDPEFLLAQSEMEILDDATGDMVQTTFEIMDGVIAGQNAGVTQLASGEFNMTIEWDEVNQNWVGTFSAVDAEQGFSITASNVVQFRHATGPVQYPDPELITEISSEADFDITGSGATLSASQDVLLATQDAGATVLVNGTGRIDASFTEEFTDESGTTNCTASQGFATRVRDILLDTVSGTDSCPASGSLEFNGNLAISCTGAQVVDHDRSWSVVRTFDNGTTHTRAVSGNNVWNVEEPCL